MAVYKFYLWDATKGPIFLGTLPERRKNPKRIIGASIINWWKKYFGRKGKGLGYLFHKNYFGGKPETAHTPLTTMK